MSRSAFDAEVALDLAVNMIPLAILVFFVAVFAVFNPWGFDPLRSGIQFAIIVSMIVGLAIATYFAARVVETDDHTRGQPPESK
jgi:hypothetical protein